MGAIWQFVFLTAHESPALMLIAPATTACKGVALADSTPARLDAAGLAVEAALGAVWLTAAAMFCARRKPIGILSRPALIADVTSAGVSDGGSWNTGSEPTGAPGGGTRPSGTSWGSGHVLYSWSQGLVQRPTPGGSPGGKPHVTAKCWALPFQSPAETTVLFHGTRKGRAACSGAGALEGWLGVCLRPAAAADRRSRAWAAASARTLSCTARAGKHA